jgi:hypothetical protein
MIYTLNRLLLLLFTSFCFAQQDVVTSGGDANSADGSFSYTVGQILVSQQVRSSSIWSKEAITLNHGVQQFFIPKCVNNDNVIINAYPNPSNGIVNITLSDWDDIEITLSVYNVLGMNILSQKIFKNQTQLNLTSLSAGIYLLSINNICGAASTFKLIITN